MLGKVGQSVLGNEDMRRPMTDVMVMGGLMSWSKEKTGMVELSITWLMLSMFAKLQIKLNQKSIKV